MPKYAQKTRVTVQKSRAEIERILQRYGCDDFAYRNNQRMAQIAFRMNDRMIRFDLDLPDLESFRRTPTGRRRENEEQVRKAWEQACRQRWRALALVIKAKLEAVEAGITTFEREFFANILLPDGQSVYEAAAPRLEESYRLGRTPPLLPPPES